MPYYVTAQAIGVAAMCANILSYQFRVKRYVILCQLLGSLLFCVNMFMLGAVMGGLLNVVGILRALIYLKDGKNKARRTARIIFFALLYLLSYALTFTVFGKDPSAKNIIVELLPVIGMAAFTIGLSGKSAKHIRLFAFINSPAWLIYNCFNFSIGGILCEVFSLVSTLTAFLRHDLKAPSDK